MPRLRFQLEAVAPGSRARAATFETLHGTVQTPVFMPVATVASVRGQSMDIIERTGAQVLLANTYHLLLRPGPKVFRKMGGIHGFAKWNRPVLTDSGGFQIFSLPYSRKMTEAGAEFRSFLDGERILLSPEKSIDTQTAIGSDIMMALDQCIPSTADRTQSLEALELTYRWAQRSLAARRDSAQSMFAIVQGACFTDLRKQSASMLTELAFDGFAIGGLAVGESRQQREDTTEWTAELLPHDLPRYLMGVGTPIDILEAVHRGVDMFDCILPTAWAQQGVAFTSRGRIDLRRGVHKFSEEPLDPACDCVTCREHSRAYLHHLAKCGEAYGWQRVAEHNLAFYHRMMSEIRASILDGSFVEYYRRTKPILEASDLDHPKIPPIVKSREAVRIELGDYEVVTNPIGTRSIRQKSTGEVMHSVSDPEQEARVLYIEQSALARRLREPATQGSVERGSLVEQRALDLRAPLIVWDVGLGAATNAMAAIRCAEELGRSESAAEPPRELQLVSFENDLDSLRLASRNAVIFPHLRHGAPKKLLEKMEWRSPNPTTPILWTLLEGDFTERMADAPRPDLVFYDPFSLNADSELWTLEAFRRLFKYCGEEDCEIFTYSASTAVRVALLEAGFFVARGVPIAPKDETTVALSPKAWIRNEMRHEQRHEPWHELLGMEWLARWERSGTRYPTGLDDSAESRLAFEASVRAHPQFQRRE